MTRDHFVTDGIRTHPYWHFSTRLACFIFCLDLTDLH